MRNKVSNSRILSVLLIVFLGVFFAGICDAATQVAPVATISEADIVPEEYVDSGEDAHSVANQELKIMDQENPVEECRDAIHKNRLYREAYDVLYPWTLDSKNTDKESLLEGINLTNTCLLNLGRYDEQSAYYEKLLEVHAQNWMVHQTVANLYQSIPHFGVLIDNEFYRGMDPGNGPQYSAAQHDIVRGMQIMRQAMPLVEQAAQDPRERGKITSFYLGYAERFYSDAWKMQILTDMETLPEPEMMEYDYARRGNPGAPVDEAGNPVFFALPESFETAQNDGERWRYLLNRAMEYDDSVRCLIYRRIADFSIQYFGVETLTHYNYFSSRDTVTADNDDKNGIWSLASLSDSETIARLANGVKRFELPDDYNYIRLYEQVLEIGDVWNKYQARETLARIYMNRRQYDRAAEYYKAIIDNWDEKAQGKKNRRNGQYEQIQRKYEQITGNWGRFEPMESKVAGTDVTLSWRFRNGSKVSFTAQKVEVVKLWQDIEDYLKKHEKELANKLDYQRIGCWERIGYDLVTDSEVRGKYLGGEVANWSVDLDPPAGHYDALTAIDFPVKEAGMYLVTATMENGNTNHIIVNLNDMAIVRKPIDKAQYFYVADAKTGKPVPNAKLHLFGYGQKEKKRLIRDNDYILVTRELNGTTDQHGQYFLKYSKNNPEEINDYAWYATATDEAGKRFAVLGFQHIWYPYKYDSEYHNVRAYFVSDRPVYRPEQTVEFKFWVGTSKYDMPETCEWAERTV
ncbi:MAG: hypothetical protein IKW74_02385, partial [Thermoguttaceae bacterium]|nr:hypothetical protein [Thermoguttaceae bacterium]